MQQAGTRRRDLAAAAGLFALAALLRCAYVWSVFDEPSVQLPALDSRAYSERAQRILAGDWLGESVFYQDPLYPYFLAVLYGLFGVGSVGVLGVQALLDAGSVALVFGIARRVLDLRWAVLAGLFAAFYRVFIYFDALLLKVALSLFLTCLALLLLLEADRRGRPAAWLLAGVALGLAALTRGNALLFVPVLALWIALSGATAWRRRALALASLGLGLGLAIAPVTLRNYVVGGDWVLVTSQAGQNFYVGNHRKNNAGTYKAPPFVRPHPFHEEEDFAAEAERRTGRVMTPSERSRFWLAETLREIRADPGHFGWLLWRKARLFLNDFEVPDNQSFRFFQRQVSPWLRLPLPDYGVLLPLGLLGAFAARRSRAARLLALFFLTWAASMVATYNMSRYRVPAVPALIVLAAGGCGWLVARARERRWRALVPALLFLGVAFPFVNADVVARDDLHVYHLNLGRQLRDRGEAHRNLAFALRRSGDLQGARRERDRAEVLTASAEAQLRLALAERPGATRAIRALRALLYERALAHQSGGEHARGAEGAEGLVREFPSWPRGHALLGALYVDLGRLDEAERVLEGVLEIAPEEPRARATLARLRALREARAPD